MGRVLRIYYVALFGALGGLLGWMLFGELIPREWDWWMSALAGGALLGALLGYAVAGVDAILDRALVRFCRYATYGILLGAVGGALGFWLGDWVNYLLVPTRGQEPTFGQMLGSVAARGFGWMFLGVAVGVSEGLAARSWSKVRYGAIGGGLGGFIGGAVFGYLMEALDKDASSYAWGQAVGLVILGGCVGLFTALVEEVFKPAALRVLRGWQEGREYPLLKPANILGRDEAADILLLRDMKIEKQHAVIERRGDRFRLVNNHAPADQTRVNGEPVPQSRDLRDGDRIQLGNVLLKFTVRSSQLTE